MSLHVRKAVVIIGCIALLATSFTIECAWGGYSAGNSSKAGDTSSPSPALNGARQQATEKSSQDGLSKAFENWAESAVNPRSSGW